MLNKVASKQEHELSSKPRVTERLREESTQVVSRRTTTAQNREFSRSCPTGWERAKIIQGRSGRAFQLASYFFLTLLVRSWKLSWRNNMCSHTTHEWDLPVLWCLICSFPDTTSSLAYPLNSPSWWLSSASKSHKTTINGPLFNSKSVHRIRPPARLLKTLILRIKGYKI